MLNGVQRLAVNLPPQKTIHNAGDNTGNGEKGCHAEALEACALAPRTMH